MTDDSVTNTEDDSISLLSAVDTTPPAVPIAVPDTTDATNQDITVTATYSDDSTLRQYKFGADGAWQDYTAAFTVSANTTIYLRAQDEAGNESTGELVISNIDKVPPVAPIATPSTTNVTDQYVVVSVVYSSDSTVRQYRIGDEGDWTDYLNDTITVYSNTTVYFRAEDEAGNESTSELVISNIDLNALPDPVAKVSTTSITNRDVTVTVAYGSRSTLRQYKIGDGEWTDYSEAFKVSENTTVYFRSENAEGVTSSSEIVISNIDKDAPAVPTLTVDVVDEIVRSVTVTAEFSSDSLYRQYRIGNGEWTDYTGAFEVAESTTVYLRAEDEAGNESINSFVIANIDSEGPAMPKVVCSTSAATNKSISVAITYSSDSMVRQYKVGNGDWLDYAGKFTLAANTTIYLRAEDIFGNETIGNVAITNIDKTAPTRGKIGLTQLNQNSIRVSISGFKDNKEIARYDVYLAGKKVGSTKTSTFTYKSTANLSGTKSFSVRAVDAAGNVSALVSAKLGVKLVVTGKATEEKASIRWGAASISGGVKQYQITVSGTKKTYKTQKTNITLKKLTAGNRTVSVYAVSKTNKKVLVAKSIVAVQDITAPKGGKVKLTQSGQNNIRISISGFKDNVKVVRYDIYAGSKRVASTTSGSYLYKSTKDLKGKQTLTVKAVDAAGNVSKAKKGSVKIKDVTAPSPVTGFKVSGTATEKTATLTWKKAYDNFGVIKQYQIKVSGVSKNFTSKKTSLTVKNLTAGSHTIQIVAVDKAGKKSKAATFKFNVKDITAPTGGKIAVKQLDQNNVRITIAGFKDNVKIARYNVYLNGKYVGKTTGSTYTYTQKSNLTASKMVFSVRAVDSTGNASAAQKADFIAPLRVSGKATDLSTVLTWSKPAISGTLKYYEVIVAGKTFTSTTNTITLKGLTAGKLSVTILAVNTKKQTKLVCSDAMISVAPTPVNKTISGLANATYNVTCRDLLLTGKYGIWKTSLDEDQIAVELGAFYNALSSGAKGGYITGSTLADTITFAANRSRGITGMSLGAGNDRIVMQDSAEKQMLLIDTEQLPVMSRVEIYKIAGVKDSGIIDMGAGNDAVSIGDNVLFSGDVACKNEVALSMGAGNDKVELGEHAMVRDIDFDFGAGNDTFLMGENSILEFSSVNFGSGKDTMRMNRGATFDSTIDFGDGDDKLIVDSGVILNGSLLNFGEGNDTLVLNGSLGLGGYNSILGLEKLEGSGSILINEEEAYDAAQVQELVDLGFDIINTGIACSGVVADKAAELADNRMSGAVEIPAFVSNSDGRNFWLCGAEKAESLNYGFCDETDWFKFTVDQQYDGILWAYTDNTVVELYDAEGTKICDVDVNGVDLKTFSVGSTYYLKATISSGSAVGTGFIQFFS